MVTLIQKNSVQELPIMSKEAVANQILDVLSEELSSPEK